MSEDLLQADRLDGYTSACLHSPINSLARRLCHYIPWNDQSLAKIAKEMLPNENVKIIILTPSADGGMPHTRAPNIICLPAYYPESRLKETLAHELVHISQRKNPQEWSKRALSEGWMEVSEHDIPAEYVSRCRLNPDTFDSRFWAWEGRHVPLPLFIREEKPELREISLRWWDMSEKRLSSHRPSSFTRKYGNVSDSSAEHPYELWAYE